MSTVVKLLKDVYPFGCKGDLRPYADEELAELKAKVNKLGLDHAFETVEQAAEDAVSTAEADVKKAAETAVDDAKQADSKAKK